MVNPFSANAGFCFCVLLLIEAMEYVLIAAKEKPKAINRYPKIVESCSFPRLRTTASVIIPTKSNKPEKMYFL